MARRADGSGEQVPVRGGLFTRSTPRYMFVVRLAKASK